jgi:hypothetical protein
MTRQGRKDGVRQGLPRQVQHELSAEIDLTRWVGPIGLAVVIGREGAQPLKDAQ